MRSNPVARMGFGAVFVFVRLMERMLSPRGLRRFLTPFIATRVAFRHRQPSLPLPGCLGSGAFRISKRQQRISSLNTIPEFFPDRLGTSKWRNRLQIEGVQYLETARREKRPVILAFCHFGSYSLLRYWLRAVGFPAATIVRGHSQDRSIMRRLKDRVSPFPEIRTAFHRDDQLRDAIEFLASGNPLLIAIDVLIGKKMEVPMSEDWYFAMSSGAIRMAARHGAELIPCSIVDEGDWHFQIHLGPPVPASLLTASDPLPAGKYLVDAMLPVWRERPEQFSKEMFRKFRRVNLQNGSSDESIRSGQLIAG